MILENDGNGQAVGDLLVRFDDAIVAGRPFPGRCDHHGIAAQILRHPRQVPRRLRPGVTGADDDRHALLHSGNRTLDERFALAIGQPV